MDELRDWGGGGTLQTGAREDYELDTFLGGNGEGAGGGGRGIPELFQGTAVPEGVCSRGVFFRHPSTFGSMQQYLSVVFVFLAGGDGRRG